jgi:hypothetical protein
MTAVPQTSLTPEMARRLATLLAPHLVAMRAVLAGTSYAEPAGGSPGSSGEAAISPATTIFIAGMLDRASA